MGAQPTLFVAKINCSGTELVYLTFRGGEDDDFGLGITVDGPGNAYVTGATGSGDFSTASIQPATSGSTSGRNFKLFQNGRLPSDGPTVDTR